jgi:type VI secretion system lysozyme-like protein
MKKAIDYKEPKPFYGIKRPLFDLLVDDAPHTDTEDYAKNFMNSDEVVASVVSEISKILNTRRTLPAKDYESMKNDPLNFGIPSLFGLADFQSFDGASPAQWGEIARLCEQAITRFEPRIQSVFAKVNQFNPHTQALEIIITGKVLIGKLLQQVTFPVDLVWSGAR